jgi:hypothetical protein
MKKKKTILFFVIAMPKKVMLVVFVHVIVVQIARLVSIAYKLDLLNAFDQTK